MIEAAQTAIGNVAEQRIGNAAFRPMREVSLDAYEEILRNVELDAAGITSGVTTGFTRLNEMTGGFQPTDFIIEAARPSMGKTALMMGHARGAARGGKIAGVISMEMSAKQLVIRGLAEDLGYDAQQLRMGRLGRNPDESRAMLKRLADVVATFSEQGIWLDDKPSQSIQQIRARARVQQQRSGLDILFVDYLQLATDGLTKRQKDSREQEISAISRGLKALAKELNIPVVALSQLNRNLESRGDKRPQLSDLRESGSLEQDADVVMFVHRPEYYGITTDEQGAPTEGMAEIIIGKQRNGPTGTAKLAFIKEQCAFKDLETKYGDAPQYLEEPYTRRYGDNEQAF